ncbi:MAG: DUF2244 domain-containing protein [Rubrivivax sp.]
MSVATIPSAWPQSPDTARRLPWLFGREVVLDGNVGAPRALQWLFKRNCSITPAQMGCVYLSLCSVSLLVAGFFFLQGATFVLAFAGLELLALGVALLVYARHAGDRETLTLARGCLQVEQCIGSRVERVEFAAEWLRVEPAGGQGSLVELSGRGQCVRVGRFLRPELRAPLARELRQALRHALGRASQAASAAAAA